MGFVQIHRLDKGQAIAGEEFNRVALAGFLGTAVAAHVQAEHPVVRGQGG